MARYEHLPLWRDAQRLILLLEQAVRGFPRYHKYTLGTDLRRQALQVGRLIIRANTQREVERLRAIEELVYAVEELKLLIQLAKELRAFNDFRAFQAAAELAVALGKQSGGWWKRAGSTAQVPCT